MSAAPAAEYERESQVGIIRLQRPEERNMMSAELLQAFGQAAAEAAADDESRAVVVVGTGDCFSAGADLRGALQGGEGLAHERSYAMYKSFLSVLDIRVPVIGALNGHAVGGGFGLALLCDLRIANRTARYGANFVRIGLHPGLGITDMLPRLVGLPRAAELLLTGELITGERGAQIGLFNQAVEEKDVLKKALELAGQIAGNGPVAVRTTKRSLYRHAGWNPRLAAMDEAYAQAASLATDEASEGIQALLEKRSPRF